MDKILNNSDFSVDSLEFGGFVSNKETAIKAGKIFLKKRFDFYKEAEGYVYKASYCEKNDVWVVTWIHEAVGVTAAGGGIHIVINRKDGKAVAAWVTM